MIVRCPAGNAEIGTGDQVAASIVQFTLLRVDGHAVAKQGSTLIIQRLTAQSDLLARFDATLGVINSLAGLQRSVTAS
ncbi:hypothetical protein BW31_02003 [Pantoea agglomerans]|nr:hypothetical protein BW31_02003 [Pantoea agglomerans]